MNNYVHIISNQSINQSIKDLSPFVTGLSPPLAY